MSVVEVTYYVVKCDRCDRQADYGDYSAWSDPDGATESLGDGWLTTDDMRHFCDDCIVWDGSDNEPVPLPPIEAPDPTNGGEHG